MKRVGSVLMAEAKPLLWKFLLLLLLAAALQTGLFYRLLTTTSFGYDALLSTSGAAGGFRFGILILCLLMIIQSCRASDLTVRRLAVDEFAVTGLWALVHLAYLAVFWAFQLAVFYGLWLLYTAVSPVASGWGLELVMACYADPFLHGLMPLNDVLLHVRNVVWILALAAETAAYGWFYRRGRKRPVELMILLVMGAGFFGASLDQSGGSGLQIFVCLALMGITLYGMWEVRYREEN